jgi:hypothetical protein
MIRTRSCVLSLALFLCLSGGTSSASKSSPPASPRLGAGAGGVTNPHPRRRHAKPAMRLRRGQEPSLNGAGQCPTGIEIELWPPNHKYVDIDLGDVLGLDPNAIEILSITQDEAVDERGSGNTECDGNGVGTSVAHIRSERSGRGNGRVYEIEYSAFNGGCSGFVHVTVPHDQSGDPAEDDGQDFDSTEGCECH